MRKLRRFFWVLLLGYSVLLLLGWLTDRQQPFFLGSQRHPYIFLVDCLAVVFGWREGLIAAAVGCLLLAAGHGIDSQAPWHPDVEIGLQMILRALLFGLLSGSLRNQLATLRRDLLDQGARLIEKEENERALQASNGLLRDELERLNREREPVHRAAERLLALTREEEVRAALLEVVAQALGAQRCSYYLKEGQALRLAASFGWPSGTEPEKRITEEQHMVRRAADEKTLQTIRDFPVEAIESQGAQSWRLLAAPVLDPERGMLYGVVAVDQLPFERLTRANATLLASIAGVAGKAISQAVSSASQRDSDPGAGGWQELLSPSDLLRRLRMLVLGRQEGARPPFCLLTLGVQSQDALPELTRLRVERGVALLARAHARPQDEGGRASSGELVFLLEHASPEAMQPLMVALAAQLTEFLPLWVPEAQNLTVMLGLSSAENVRSAEEAIVKTLESAQPCHLLT